MWCTRQRIDSMFLKCHPGLYIYFQLSLLITIGFTQETQRKIFKILNLTYITYILVFPVLYCTVGCLYYIHNALHPNVSCKLEFCKDVKCVLVIMPNTFRILLSHVQNAKHLALTHFQCGRLSPPTAPFFGNALCIINDRNSERRLMQYITCNKLVQCDANRAHNAHNTKWSQTHTTHSHIYTVESVCRRRGRMYIRTSIF